MASPRRARVETREDKAQMSTAGGSDLALQQQLLDTFVEFADTLVEDFDVVDFLSRLTKRVVELDLAAEAGILLANSSGGLRLMAASHERSQLLELLQVEVREGPCQDTFDTGAQVVVADLEAEQERWPTFGARALELGFRSVVAVPLRLRGDVLGGLNLFSTQAGDMDHVQRSVVQAIADVVTISLIQYRELEHSQSVAAQLQHALSSRVTIEQAKGVLAEQLKVSPDEAFVLLRDYARSTNRKIAAAATGVVEGTISAQDTVRQEGKQ